MPKCKKNQIDMDCKNINFSRHAIRRMFERDISPDAVLAVLKSGEEIADYPDDNSPATLLLGRVDEMPLHVLVARSEESRDCIIVTCYVPEADSWSDDFTKRKP